MDPETYIPSRRAHYGIESLELTEEAVWQLPKVPRLHTDPFDRILICQAIVHGLIILTPDEHISRLTRPRNVVSRAITRTYFYFQNSILLTTRHLLSFRDAILPFSY